MWVRWVKVARARGERIGCGSTGGDVGGTFSAHLHHVQGNTNAEENRYQCTNDLITQTNTAESTCCYMETRVRVQQGLEGPLDLRSSKLFPPVDRGTCTFIPTHTHTQNERCSYEPD